MLTKAGFVHIESTTDSRQAKPLFIKHKPDLVLLDLRMPHLDGLDVMAQLSDIAEASYLPILILSADVTPEARRDALSRGAKDFLNKPFQPDEILLRIKTLLETRLLYVQIQSQNQMLEAKVRERTRALEEAQVEIVERLAMAAEFRDDNTGQHTQRVGQMSALVARQLGLPDTQVSLIRRAAPLHDVGKIGVPDTILMKLGKLTEDEFTVVKTHTVDRRAYFVGRQVSAAAAGGGNRVLAPRALGRHGLRFDRRHQHSSGGPHRRRCRRVRRADAAAALQAGVADS